MALEVWKKSPFYLQPNYFYRDSKLVCRIGSKKLKMHILKTDSYNKNKYHGPKKLTVLRDFYPSLMNQ